MFKVHPRQSKGSHRTSLELFPSEFTSHMMRMPHEGVLAPFSFTGREYLVPIYDTPHPRTLLMFARQSEKSTTLGNKILALSCLRHHFKSLFVSPSQQQTEVFSRDKLSSPLNLSEDLRTFLDKNANNVLFKRFITDSSVTLRYAFLHADRTRGIPADALFLDEIQDILTDVIPIIEECMSHSPYQLMTYSGTPKSLDNTIAYYWNTFSTQNEWMIPCDRCGGADYRHWDVIGYDNIGPNGLICSRCKRDIDPRHPEAQWVSQRSARWLQTPDGIPFEGYRIPQILTNWVNWPKILDKKSRYGKAQFYNEVLALPYDSGDKPIKRETLAEQCGSISFADSVNFAGRSTLYMGIDWGGTTNAGGGEEGSVRKSAPASSYTVVSIGGYLGGKFQYIYFKRFEGEEAVMDNMLPVIIQLVDRYKISIIGTDYGGGLHPNDRLIRQFGIRRVARYQYVNTRKIYFNKDLHHWMVNRTEALMALINAINRKDEIRFPTFGDWEFPFAQDLLSVFTEYNSSNTQMIITKAPGSSDDTMHSMMYCWLASMIEHPRPDILAADRSP